MKSVKVVFELTSLFQKSRVNLLLYLNPTWKPLLFTLVPWVTIIWSDPFEAFFAQNSTLNDWFAKFIAGAVMWSSTPSKFKCVAGTIEFTATTISVLALSQPFAVEDTQYDVEPTVVVDGVGAVVLPVPPVAVVYHNKPVPVAVKGLAVTSWL